MAAAENNKVGKAIAFLRKRAGYTQKDLADRIGISDKAVSKWERGVSLPDIAYLSKLAILLDTDSDSLLAGDVIHHDSGWAGLLVFDDNDAGVGPLSYIYDKPLAHYLIGSFMLVGIKEIFVCCSGAVARALETEYADGGKFGITLHYLACNAADAVRAGMLPQQGNLMVMHGRSIIFGVDQTRFFQRAMHHTSRVSVLALAGREPVSDGLCFDLDRRIVESTSSERVMTQYGHRDLPIFFCPAAVLSKTFDSKTGLFSPVSLAPIHDVYAEILDRGFVELRIDSWDDVEEAAMFFKLVQRRCGTISYCLEEIAWRRGFVSTEELLALADACDNAGYRNYILGLT